MEINSHVPCTVVVDNDDFKSDTLTGDATVAHCTNIMFIQPEYLEILPDNEEERRTVKKTVIKSTIRQSVQ